MTTSGQGTILPSLVDNRYVEDSERDLLVLPSIRLSFCAKTRPETNTHFSLYLQENPPIYKEVVVESRKTVENRWSQKLLNLTGEAFYMTLPS